jgi:hypothetical protein
LLERQSDIYALRRKKKKAETIRLRAFTQNRTVKLLSPECNPSNITTQGTTNLAVAKQKETRRGGKKKKGKYQLGRGAISETKSSEAISRLVVVARYSNGI